MVFFRSITLRIAHVSGLLGLAIFSYGYPLAAEQRELGQPRGAVDAVLLIDSSGSMLKTDARNLRYEGAKLFLKFLGEQDRLAVISFSDGAQVVSDLREFKKESLGDTLKKIEAIKTEGQFTDLYEGIKKSEAILNASPRNDAERIIILLSDGKMEPNPAVAMPATRTVELVNDLLPELKSKEIRVHSLSFSDQADKVLLGEVAAATDGLSWFTTDSEQVHKSFADLFLVVKRPQVLPMTSKGFNLDDDVDEATFYITRDEAAKVTLISPKNEEMNSQKIPEWVTWFSGKNFDVITMREPDPGEWQVFGGASAESFATVLTHLKLVTDWPVIIRSEDKNIVQARLYDGDKPVSLPEMSGVVRYAFQVSPTDKIAEPVIRDFLNDEGKDGDKIARDGIFSRYCTLTDPGEYKLSIVARGPTFERSQQVPFRVRPRLLSLSVMSPEEAEGEHSEAQSHDGHGAAAPHNPEHAEDHGDEGGAEAKAPALHGNQHYVIRANLSKEALSFKSFEIDVEALSESRKKTVLKLKRSAHDPLVYEVTADGLPADGRYSLKALLKGETKKFQEVEAESKPVSFELSMVRKKEVHHDTPVPKEPVAPVKAEKPPFLEVGLVLLANVLIGALGFILTKKNKAGVAVPTKYIPPKQVLEAIADLEEKVTTPAEAPEEPSIDGGTEPSVEPKSPPQEMGVDEGISALADDVAGQVEEGVSSEAGEQGEAVASAPSEQGTPTEE